MPFIAATPSPVWPALFLAALIGHFGLHVAIYNRLNSCGLRRRTVKRIELIFVFTALLIPTLTVSIYPTLLRDVIFGRPAEIPLPNVLIVYGTICLSTWVVFGIPWLMWRPIFALEWAKAPRDIEIIDVQKTTDKPLARSLKCKLQSRLPLNQVLELSIDHIQLPVLDLPKPLAGYRIAQLSDIHFTGDIEPEYIGYAVERAAAWRPDMFTLTGDIIDDPIGVDWLANVFSPARAPDGAYFILGNHDTRLLDPQTVRDEMNRAGWTDLGSRVHRCNLHGIRTLVIGNEHPWFRRPDIEHEGDDEFRLLLSHSPDEIGWARRHRIHLMLAGHTHGGQGRLPLAGPLLSPSFHGSRFASGDFLKPPTTMHVSRGMGGVHLLRINCRPELSLITLQPA